MEDQDLPLDGLVLAYRKIRDTINDKESQHKEEIAELRVELDAIAAKLLGVCNDTNADSIKTAVGTVSRRIQSRYWTSDWESMYSFIGEHSAPFLLEQRIHNGNMKQFLEDNPDAFPPGLQADRKYVVQVRKPTAK